MLSLASITALRIVGHITTNVVCQKGFRNVSCVIEEVKKDIDSLNLPHILDETVKRLIQPIYFYVANYYYLLYCCEDININVLSKLVFTIEGEVHRKMSTYKIVMDETLDIRNRVILACTFCFEEEVLKFKKSNPGIFSELTNRANRSTIRNWLKHIEETAEPLEQFLWRDLRVLETVFLEAVEETNLEAAEYFYHKMTRILPAEKVGILEAALQSLERFSSHPSLITRIKIRDFQIFLSEKIKYYVNERIIFARNHSLKRKALIKKLKALHDQFNSYFSRINSWKKKVRLFENNVICLRSKREIFLNKEKLLLKEENMFDANDQMREKNIMKKEAETLRNEEAGLDKEHEMLEEKRKMLVEEDEILETENNRLESEEQLLNNEEDIFYNEYGVLNNE